MNPFLRKFIQVDHEEDDQSICAHKILHDALINHIDHETALGPPGRWLIALHKPISSWRNMLFTQPAITSFHAWCFEEGCFFDIEDQSGLTVNPVVKLLKDHFDFCAGCPFSWKENNRWSWMEEEDVDLVHDGITGWEMFDRLKASVEIYES